MTADRAAARSANAIHTLFEPMFLAQALYDKIDWYPEDDAHALFGRVSRGGAANRPAGS
jgi:hypothetical protein